MLFVKQRHSTFRTRRVAPGLLLAPLAAVFTGCARCAIHTKAAIVFVVDVSHSTDSQREAMLDNLDLATVRACADRTPLSVWVFAERPLQVWYGVPNSTGALAEVKGKYMPVSKASDHSKHVTRPGALLAAVAKEKRLVGGLPMHLFVATDGDSEDSRDLPTFKAAAKSLTGRQGFKVWVLGIDPVNRDRWDSAFAGSSPANVTLAVSSQAQQALIDGLR